MIQQVDQDGNPISYTNDPNYVYVDGVDVQMQDTNNYSGIYQPTAMSTNVLLNGQQFVVPNPTTPQQSVTSPFLNGH